MQVKNKRLSLGNVDNQMISVQVLFTPEYSSKIVSYLIICLSIVEYFVTTYSRGVWNVSPNHRYRKWQTECWNSKIENCKSKLANQNSEFQNWKLEIENRKSKIGNRKSEFWNLILEIEISKSKAGILKSETGNRKLKLWNGRWRNFGRSSLGGGHESGGGNGRRSNGSTNQWTRYDQYKISRSSERSLTAKEVCQSYNIYHL